MQLKRLFTNTKRRWQYDAEEGWIVWKLQAAPEDRLLIEERNPTRFESRLRMFDAVKGRSLWVAISPIDPWWSNLSAVSGDRALVEGYTSRDLPIPKGVAALDIATGALAWSDPEAQLVEVRAHTVLVRRTQHGIDRQEVLRLVDGMATDDSDDDVTTTTDVQYPTDVDATAISAWLTPEEVTQLRGPIELIERPDVRVFCYYLQNARDAGDLMRQTFRCELRIEQKQTHNSTPSAHGLRETLAARSPFPVAGNFVVLHDILIYVQEKTRLTGVHLT